MNKQIKDFKLASIIPMFIYCFVAVLLFVVNLYIYQIAPFEGALNDAVLNSIIVFSALMVAMPATVIFSHYHQEDFPRKVWLYVMIACWFWFFAELAWGAISFVRVEVPAPHIPDVGWVVGFVLFTIAFYYQYAAIYPARKQRVISFAIGAWTLAIFIPLIVLLAVQTLTAEAYINYYYPVADLSLGIAGISLMFVFRGGALMRPWLGLVVFGISDFFYAWAEQTGIYAWSAENSNLLTFAIDTSYLVAYLILGLGFVSHWILINYGLRGEQN